MFDIFNMLKKEENAAPKQVTRDTIIGDILDTAWAALHPAARASKRPARCTAWTAMS